MQVTHNWNGDSIRHDMLFGYGEEMATFVVLMAMTTPTKLYMSDDVFSDITYIDYMLAI